MVVILAASAMGCVRWSPLYISPSPDGRVELKIFGGLSSLLPYQNLRVRVEIATTDRSFVLYEALNDDWFIKAVHVAWQSSDRVGILICNAYSSDLSIGYDFVSKQKISSHDVRRLIAGYVADRYPEYQRTENVDPLEWACGPEGPKMFEHGLWKLQECRN